MFCDFERVNVNCSFAADLSCCVLTAGASDLPPNWEKRLDESTGRYYYVNHATKRTQWDPPPGEHLWLCVCVCAGVQS